MKKIEILKDFVKSSETFRIYKDENNKDKRFFKIPYKNLYLIYNEEDYGYNGIAENFECIAMYNTKTSETVIFSTISFAVDRKGNENFKDLTLLNKEKMEKIENAIFNILDEKRLYKNIFVELARKRAEKEEDFIETINPTKIQNISNNWIYRKYYDLFMENDKELRKENLKNSIMNILRNVETSLITEKFGYNGVTSNKAIVYFNDRENYINHLIYELNNNIEFLLSREKIGKLIIEFENQEQCLEMLEKGVNKHATIERKIKNIIRNSGAKSINIILKTENEILNFKMKVDFECKFDALNIDNKSRNSVINAIDKDYFYDVNNIYYDDFNVLDILEITYKNKVIYKKED